MPPVDAVSLRCDHCGRPVRGTQHTRGAYRVDYYALHGGNGDIVPLIGDNVNTYVRLLDRFDVVSCAQCFPLPAVQAELERRFHPERERAEKAGGS